MKALRTLPACALLALAAPSFAQSSADEGFTDKYRLRIARLPLPAALKEFSRQTGLQVGYLPLEATDDAVLSAPLKGRYTADVALRKLLEPSGLTFERINERTIAVTLPDAATSEVHGDRVRIAQDGSAGGGGAPRWQLTRLYLGESSADEVHPPRLVLAQADEALITQAPEPTVPRPQSVEEIVVTGTHIRGAAPVGSRVMVIDRDAIEASGYGRVQDLLETLPQNFSGSIGEDSSTDVGSGNLNRGQAVDLRGLGGSSTLVLVNGRRQPMGGLQGSFVDISSIAASAVERIEIMADGASALYGSDAIGGVVNFVLRKDYDGAEAGVRFGTVDGAAHDLQASLLVGNDWDSGNVLFGYQYSHRDALMAADAAWARYGHDYRALGGDDYRFAAGNPGTILDAVTGLPAYAIPAGQDGTNLTVADLIPGQGNYSDEVKYTAALPEQEQHSAFASLSQDIGARFSAYAEGRFSERRMTQSVGEPVAVLFVPPTNPFYIDQFDGGGILASYSFIDDFGGQPLTQQGETTMYQLTAGAVTQLGARWQMNTALSFGRERSTWEFINDIGYDRLDAALSDPDPVTALNVFGDGAHTNPATIDGLRETSISDGESTMRNASLVADGPVLQLPAGTARLALGGDYRDERLSAHYGSLAVASGEVVPNAFFTVGDVRRDVTAFFGELSLPVLGRPEREGRGVEVSLAGRYEDYSDFGSTFNPKIGLQVAPMKGVVVRGSWGTSFRVPRFNEMKILTNPFQAFAARGVQDPQSPTGFSNILVLSGGNPDLQPETAKVWTAGVELRPTSLPDLQLTASYFDIAYEDKIQRAGDGATRTLLAEDQWRDIIVRDPSQAQIDGVCNRPGFLGTCPTDVAAIIDIRIQNIGVVNTRGIDFGLDYGAGLPLGRLSVSVNGTYVLTYERAVSPSASPMDVLDTVGNPLDLRLRAGIGWEAGPWRANAFVNYSDGYENAVNDQPVDSWTTVDLSIGYHAAASGWLGGTVTRLAATNVFDRAPPFANTYEGFDSTNANDVGRTISLGVSKSW